MIRFENVTKRYRGTSAPALHDVDFEVQRGEFVFLVGPSGSGKSTCLRMILREETPSEGRVVVLGRDLRALSSRKVPYFRRHIGAVFQDFRLLPTKTIFQNVAFALQVIGSSRAFIRQAVPEALALVGLQDKGKRLPHELSGGEQQRVAIARAIVNRPQILLADEPTGNLDPATSVDIMQLLARINATGTTVVMATHEAGFVDEMRRRVIELHEGDVVRDERHGGYGDTSSLPSLAPGPERGAASVAALTAVLEVHRETVAAAPVADAGDASAPATPVDSAPVAPTTAGSAAPVPAKPAATAPAEPAAPAPVEPATAEQPEILEPEPEPEPEPETDAAPSQKPAPVPEPEPSPKLKPRPTGAAPTSSLDAVDVDLDELGLADRLGLDDAGDDEVGPTR